MHDYPSGIARHDRDAERVRIASAHRFAPNRETYLQYPDNAVGSVRKSPVPIRLKVQKTQMFRIPNRGAHDEGSGNPAAIPQSTSKGQRMCLITCPF
jgi:hypothetical protein